MIEPTIGRVLHFWPGIAFAKQKGMAYADSSKPLSAIITYVHSATMVNLAVFDQTGENFPVTSVELIQDRRPPLGMYCEWMPYQQGQAAKTEAAEAKACSGCGSCAASDPRVRLFLNRGAVIKVNGVPLELEHDTTVLTHAANVPLLSSEAVAACMGERAD